MYNSFIHENSLKQRRATENQVKAHQTERSRYVGVRNHLVEKYNKRIQNFIYKMEENPLQVQQYRDNQEQSPEKYKHRSTKHDFIYRKAHWDSIQKNYRTKAEDNRSFASQSLYNSNKQDSFRSRVKNKQIQIQPMRFNYVPKFVKRIRRMNQATIKRMEDDDNGTSNGESQDDVFSVASRLSRKMMFPGLGISTVVTKTSKSKEQQPKNDIDGEQNKQINKLYFKAVIDLSQKEKRLSKTAKDILHKCKVVNYKHTTDQSEKDMFETYNRQT